MEIKSTQYKRRTFMKVSTAMGGGLLLGFNFLAGCSAEEAKEKIAKLALPDNWYDMNAFIKIGENGVVTIMSPNPEIGQNVKTSMPMIIAEELDIDWKQVMVEQAGLDNNKYERQVAGGSQSIRHGWKSLRTAGAAARNLLMQAASKKWDVPFTDLRTENGMIYHDESGQKMNYGEVASQASEFSVPEDLALKDPKDFKIIGTSIPNVDGHSLVTGEPIFGMDYEEEGMLIAMVSHSPAFGMTLSGFNKDEIKSMPGIIDAIEINTDFLSEVRFGKNSFYKTNMVAIIGNSTWEVMNAKKALKADWSQNQTPESSSDHTQKLKKLLDGKAEGPRIDGNPEEAFAKASKIIEREYTAPFLPHNTMAPMNFFADVTEEGARFVGPVQTPSYSAEVVAEALGFSQDKVKVMMTRMGGGFGRRLYANWLYESAMISKAMKKPIKLIYSREDDINYGTYRPAYIARYKAGVDENNNLIALQVSGAGAHGGPVMQNRFPAGCVDNYKAENFTMDTNISTGAWRAPRSNFIAGAEQSFLDELAEEMGVDPIDFRLSLFDKAIQNPVGEENDYDPERYAGVLKLVREKSGWDKKIDGLSRGVAAYYCHNSYVAQVVDIIEKDGKPKIQKVWCAVDCGIVVNPSGAKNQIEGGTIDGIGTAMFGGIDFKEGVVQQLNFDNYRLIRNVDAPVEIETFFVENGIDPTGLGEPGLPPVIGALANALYKAKGSRFYDQPFAQGSDLLG